MRYKAFLGSDEFTYSDECTELYNKVSSFMTNIAESDGSTGTFEIVQEPLCEIPLFYALVDFPTWAEALFLIQFREYSWDILEESE
ncbi:hypothetical protein pEaSNUABM50_00194 [Erwinia phage pEa_SNUABM_50]|uniref:Uncharacterized protein n=4 Tax=Eneladusvirus BF TaxID=2560751 RepID=A0A7L8ZNR4_9CAUD|nr:hypothetical protein FDH34_gp198 [Serratia phage BF]QOI71135.1 hypothetical protein pEaSNUABM12_00197 [Erwinia phage pEa_SNUABM_12]QOI71679.1 hypothetical protein pEaSNUABM47_00195 [Erwinia phage pEa_SNUABM_47]QOI72218.1 hypothetical protein pEaSNUABM50_00194 [Erwinia phage pEa_SNUABM_50]QXO11344.1 hypothetical protein pEaSNUABM19_00198 [Erwinia phage pEa_SNUABM_19]QXO11892.1 hypothetical protein pEaSNUABM44_00196 [Erwinia phage pEa_SNUABM_44]QXO12444.1 hypothetical protein pEaSNUABM49_001